LGVTPRYVIQHNAISRSAHNLSATAKKITAMAMALLPPDLSSLTASFSFTDFCHAIGFDKGGESFKLFLAALKESGNASISLAIVNPENGKTTWQGYHWFSFWEFSEETGMAKLVFSRELADALIELKRAYARINLKDMGGLQSKYALRIFEMAVSYMSMQGRDGNGERCWYFERSVQELREMLCISDKEYNEMREFTRRVIAGPVNEINKSGAGMTITATAIKRGRKNTGYRFDCEQTSAYHSPVQKRGRPRKNPVGELPAAVPDGAKETRAEKENAHLAELYPKEYAALFDEAFKKHLKNAGAYVSETVCRTFAASDALAAMRERYGIVK
jgi:plasmid replication initiation protein